MTNNPHDPPVGMLLRLAHVHAREVFTEALRPMGLKSFQYGALAVLDRRGPCSQRRLADELSMDKSTMVRLVDDMERMGLITRTPVPSDRRTQAITLTDRGREVFAEADAVADAAHEYLLEDFTDDERRTLRDLLIRFTRYDQA
ncbi:MarR family winged helix-turn-helix transcriptional regulator [Actinomadura harenae]|uniref:MarR family winged helix-turn-helix transcriptional regulator n=1 Tax=Actinomadura harenae TaxID=2483351 RepID=UPI0013157584|nr:MarR family transcriptional regulator [Actinomadura harenae]